MKQTVKWPTLKGRLNNSITNELDALLQLQKTTPLSEHGQQRLQQLLDKKKKTE